MPDFKNRLVLEKQSLFNINCGGNSTGIQVDNQATITTSETSTAVGNLDVSSALQLLWQQLFSVECQHQYIYIYIDGPGSQVSQLSIKFPEMLRSWNPRPNKGYFDSPLGRCSYQHW